MQTRSSEESLRSALVWAQLGAVRRVWSVQMEARGLSVVSTEAPESTHSSRKQPPWHQRRLFAQQQIVSHMVVCRGRWVGTMWDARLIPGVAWTPFFSVLLPKRRYGCCSTHVLLASASIDPEKLNRYFTDVWLIGRSVSKHFRSDLVTKQAAMRGFSWVGGR